MRPYFLAVPVGHTQIKSRRLSTKMPPQRFYVWFAILDKLAIGAVAHPCPFTIIPYITVARVAGGAQALSVIIAAAITVYGGPCFFNIIGSIRSHAPIMAVFAYLSIYVE